MEYKNVSPILHDIAKNYDYQQPPDLVLKLQELIAAILRFIKELLDNLRMPVFDGADSRGVADILQILVIVVGVVTAVVVVLLALSRLKEIQRQKKIATGALIVDESPLDSTGWLALAASLNGENRHKEACRAVYMSILHKFDEDKVLAFSATKTNYEYFYALKKMPAVAAAFRKLVDLVEEIWFGDRLAENSDYQECLKQAESVRGALPQRAPVAVP